MNQELTKYKKVQTMDHQICQKNAYLFCLQVIRVLLKNR